MKQTITRAAKSKHTKRSLAFIATIIALGVIIFLFTRPLLAPELATDLSKSEAGNAKGDQQDTFDANEDLLPNGVGENIKADSFLVFDEVSGNIIASHNSKTPVAIASLTKLMTAYVTQKYGNLDDVWAVTSGSAIDIRPILGLVPGDRIIVKDLVDGMLIGSANDAASTLGAYLTATLKKPATETMNDEAKKLGMNSTHYENPIGFDSEQNYSTAEDLRLLLRVIRPLDLFTSIDRKQSYSFTSTSGKTYSVKATNTLLADDPEIHAVKTGFTDEAKGAMITAIHHDDKQFIMIILASPNREADTKLLKSQIIKVLTP